MLYLDLKVLPNQAVPQLISPLILQFNIYNNQPLSFEEPQWQLLKVDECSAFDLKLTVVMPLTPRLSTILMAVRRRDSVSVP